MGWGTVSIMVPSFSAERVGGGFRKRKVAEVNLFVFPHSSPSRGRYRLPLDDSSVTQRRYPEPAWHS